MSEETLTGRILKGVAGLYEVSVPGRGRYTCPARGLFKKLEQTPIPGDQVVITRIDQEKRTAYLHEILTRTSEMIRPRAANITQGLLVFSLVQPEVNLLVVDTMLAYMESLEIKPILCVNKTDLTDISEMERIKELYRPAGYLVLTVSAVKGAGIEDIKDILAGQVTILAGPSGVGKSSIVNALFPRLMRETGELSARIQRGKNTTRSCELFETDGNGFLADSPGFTSFDASLLPTDGIDLLFPEFEPFLGQCYYGDCIHVAEHDCAVKEQVGETVPEERYLNYVKLAGKG